jgi:hypothetical protein
MKIFQGTAPTPTAKLILGALLTACVYTSAAYAQPAFSGKFVLPHEVRWNHAVLPAGEYSIEMNSFEGPALLHSTRTRRAFYTAPPAIVDSTPGGTELRITVRQSERIVNSLNLPGMGKSLIFEPQTKAERESAAHAYKTEVAPVVTARK